MRGRAGSRPTEGRRITRGLRSSATLARRVFTAPRRILRRPAGATSVAIVEEPQLRVRTEARAPQTQPPTVPLLTGEPTKARRMKFLLVNLCTVASLAIGMGAIVLAMHEHVRLAAVLLLFCVMFDGLDGALARRFNVATPFGAQMDSLADMCSFGIATPVVAYAWLSGTTPSWVVGPVCALAGVCAAIRLARFNISPKSSSYFAGVPTTMAAAIIVIATLLMPEPVQIVPAALVAVLALLMVSTFPYVKLAQLRRVPVWLWMAPLSLALVSPPLAFAAVIGTYLASGLLLYARGSRA